MADAREESLADGIRLVWHGPAGPVELRISAADANELAWRVHDAVAFIQSGELARAIKSLKQG